MTYTPVPWLIPDKPPVEHGWFCRTCLFVFRVNEPKPSDWRSLPMNAHDVAMRRVEKIGLACPNGCQVGDWSPWSSDLTDLSTPIHDALVAERRTSL